MQGNKVRWGVLGTARIADAIVHAINLSPNGELAAVASRDLSLAQKWAASHGAPQAFGSYEALLASDTIDAVYIPLPNALHAEWSIKAMQQGKHVLCEKPLAANAAEVRDMIAASQSTGSKLMEAFMYRFHPATAHLAQLLSEGVVGAPQTIRASFGFHLQDPGDIRLSAPLAGGALMDVGCYCVNIVRLLAGAQPDSVAAIAEWADTGVEESVVGALQFPGGLLAAVDCSFKTGPNLQQGVTVSGMDGRLIMAQPFRRAGEPVQIVIDRADGGDYPSRTETVEVPGAYQYAVMVEQFADALLNDRPVPYSPEDSLGNMQVIDALKESARTGKRVAVGDQGSGIGGQ